MTSKKRGQATFFFGKSSLSPFFHALVYRNFRLFFIGQGVSLIGTWIQYIAMSWLVYRLTSSAFILGVVAFLSQIPALVFSPFAGVLIDRYDRRKVLIYTQTLAMIQAVILAFLSLKGVVTIGHVLILGFFLGLVNAVDIPGRQAFLMDLVERKESLGSAIALNSFMFNFARLAGPSIAGIMIATVGEGRCFLLNAASFLAVLISLFFIRIKNNRPAHDGSPILQGFKEGLRYTLGHAPIRAILILMTVMSLVGMSFVILLPVFSSEFLGGGPETFGCLVSSIGIGALAGTAILASRRRSARFGYGIPLAALFFSIALFVFSFSKTLWFSSFVLGIAGFWFMVYAVSSNTVVQTLVDDDKRGRVMSFYTVSFIGVAPIGSLLVGTMAGAIGANATVAIGSAICALASLMFLSRVQRLRHCEEA